MIIQMDNVSCFLGGQNRVQDITWTVRPGEHWAIIGLNGSGKTTLLNLINGYLFPSEGRMEVLGKEFGTSDWRVLRRRIGYVSSALQERIITGESAVEVVLSGRYASIGLYDRTSKKDRAKASSLLRQLDCGHAVHQPYGELSQGERQKVLIARALMNAPRLLLMDEPCAGLDIFSRQQVLASVEALALRRSSPSIVYVSHHMEEISLAFSRTLLLQKGRVFAAGETRGLLTSRNLSRFFGAPVLARWKDGRLWIRVNSKGQR